MSSGFHIEVRDDLRPALGRIGAAAGDLSAPMAEISEAVLGHTLERYRRQVSPDQVPWAKRIDDQDPGRPVLYLRGDLYNAIERDSGPNHAAVGVIGTGGPAIYAQIHQWGGTIRPKNGKALRTPAGPRASVTMPQRQFLGIEERDVAVIDDIIIAHLQLALDGGGEA